MTTTKTVVAVGKAGPLFTPDPDPIPTNVALAFEEAAYAVKGGLDRNEYARLALLCLDEASSAFGPQAKTVELVRRILIDNGIFAPEALKAEEK